ncbi:ABC transporter substrate-binding protein [Microvirga massiliensis]|uniref:ABC transporter substrate-binding protein n=1 Tax=Microvirga massiliensis TaxID=1033741 RepID=UPI00062BE705|nr:ABC transporter substrate-binding protein [Microvirga massiliensis]
MPDVTRRQFAIGAGLLGVTGARQLKLLISQAEAQGLKRVTHAVSAGDISSLDPTLAWVSAESPINPVVMEGLVSYPPGTVSTEFLPALAEGWEISDDGRTYTFALRKGVKWQGDFGEFTAEDVKFSLDRYRDANVSPWAGNYANVVDVTVIDPHRVRVTLKAPDPFFLASVATDTESVGLMVSKKAFETRGAAAMRLSPVGTGPFAFKEYVPKDRVVMVRHDAYWDGRPKLDEVVVRFMPSSSARELAMRTGEIDSMRAALDGQVLDRLTKQGFLIDNKGPEINWWLHINTRQKPLDDIRVRQAIGLAINGDEFRALLGVVATPAKAMVGQSYFGALSAEEFPEALRRRYDPAAAKKLLAEAGLGDGLKLSMIISERDDYRQMMVLMQDQLKRVGVTVDLNRVDHAFYHSQIVKHVNPLVLFGDITYPNTEILLTRAFRTGATRNFSGLSDPTFDALLDKIATSGSLEERRTLLKQAQLMVAEKAVLVPTVFTGQPLVRNKRVKLGYELKSSLALEYRYTHLADVQG